MKKRRPKINAKVFATMSALLIATLSAPLAAQTQINSSTNTSNLSTATPLSSPTRTLNASTGTGSNFTYQASGNQFSGTIYNAPAQRNRNGTNTGGGPPPSGGNGPLNDIIYMLNLEHTSTPTSPFSIKFSPNNITKIAATPKGAVIDLADAHFSWIAAFNQVNPNACDKFNFNHHTVDNQNFSNNVVSYQAYDPSKDPFIDGDVFAITLFTQDIPGPNLPTTSSTRFKIFVNTNKPIQTSDFNHPVIGKYPYPLAMRLITILAHELGHAYGLEDNDVIGSVMYPKDAGKLNSDILPGLDSALEILNNSSMDPANICP